VPAFSASVAARALLALVAVCVIAWMALSFRNDRLVQSAEEVSARPAPAAAEVQDALADLDRAATLSFDRGTIAGLEAALHVREGRLDRAAAAAEGLVREEPENADGWALLAAFTRESDPARSAEARAKLRELDPAGETARQRAEP
jgi:predicted Zn-dependent protease